MMKSISTVNWNDPVIRERLFKLLCEGLTASQIGERMGASRSAITGVVDRWRKSNRLPPGVGFLYATTHAANRAMRETIKKNPQKKIDIVATGQLEVVKVYDIKEPVSLEKFNKKRKGIPIVKLKKDQCHWPVRDDPYLFCGKKTDAGPYCEFHAKWNSRPFIPRRKPSNFVPRVRAYR